MVTCGKGADLLALLCVMFCVFVPCGVLGRVGYLIVSIPDLCLLTYFKEYIPSRVSKSLGPDQT